MITAVRLGHDILTGDLDDLDDLTTLSAVLGPHPQPSIPGRETMQAGRGAVGHWSIQPDLTVAHDELHIANDPVVVGPSFALNETEDRDTPVGERTSIGAEHYGTTPRTLISDTPCLSIVNAPVDSPDHNGSIMDIAARRQQLIDLVESFPEVEAEFGGDANQHVGFAVREKRFAWYLDDHHGDDTVALTCKAPQGVNTELATQKPGRFFIPSYIGKRGWLGVRLDLPTIDWEEIADLVDDAYRMTAPKSLLARLDGNSTLPHDQ